MWGDCRLRAGREWILCPEINGKRWGRAGSQRDLRKTGARSAGSRIERWVQKNIQKTFRILRLNGSIPHFKI
jgi:hypothetical protein